MMEITNQLVGLILSTYRTRAGLSQSILAHRSGVSQKTIDNWESGKSGPTVPQISRLLRALHVSSFQLAYDLRHPNHAINEAFEEDAIRMEFHALYDTASAEEMEQLIFLKAGHHGGDYWAALQLAVAQMQCTMRDRYKTAQQIVDAYDFAKSTGHLSCPDATQPDLAVLHQASEMARSVALEGKNGYVKKEDA